MPVDGAIALSARPFDLKLALITFFSEEYRSRSESTRVILIILGDARFTAKAFLLYRGKCRQSSTYVGDAPLIDSFGYCTYY